MDSLSKYNTGPQREMSIKYSNYLARFLLACTQRTGKERLASEADQGYHIIANRQGLQ
jgi:hypothetical protein